MAAPFALAPGLADPGILNFTTKTAKGIHKCATKLVHSNPEEKCDGMGPKLPSFLHPVGNQAQEFGWTKNGILDVDIVVGLSTTVHLVDHCTTSHKTRRNGEVSKPMVCCTFLPFPLQCFDQAN